LVKGILLPMITIPTLIFIAFLSGFKTTYLVLQILKSGRDYQKSSRFNCHLTHTHTHTHTHTEAGEGVRRTHKRKQ
jgi:hypothetical protein